jgi:hypothetical protein
MDNSTDVQRRDFYATLHDNDCSVKMSYRPTSLDYDMSIRFGSTRS